LLIGGKWSWNLATKQNKRLRVREQKVRPGKSRGGSVKLTINRLKKAKIEYFLN